MTILSLSRRLALALPLAGLVLAATGAPAQAGTPADDFVTKFATALVDIVNRPEPAAQKKAALGPVIDGDVDVAKIARFCLGRFWNTATPDQRAQYVTLFHQVLLNAISGHLGAYRGVSFTLTGDTPQGANTLVGTLITRPNAPQANVQWVVDASGPTPKVIDVIAEGTSMRLTQRSDYASFLGQHADSVTALIAALKHQIAAAG